jgi:hypothetical protein
VTEWLGPSPALGAHRYIWLAFKGSMMDAKKNDARICWSLSKFMCAADSAALAWLAG